MREVFCHVRCTSCLEFFLQTTYNFMNSCLYIFLLYLSMLSRPSWERRAIALAHTGTPPPELLGVLFFTHLLYHQSIFILKCRQYTKWQSIYWKFIAIVMQYYEVILEPLFVSQTMPKNGEIPIALHRTPPNI